MMKRLSVSLLLVLFAASFGSFASAPARAQTLLTVINTASGETRELTRADLEALPQVTVVTANEFVDGKRRFRGPLARDIQKLAGAEGARFALMRAANDYEVEVPTAEFRKYDAILALTMDGRPLSRRDKGPIWMIYPMSDYPELQDPVYNSRLIWQLVRIAFR